MVTLPPQQQLTFAELSGIFKLYCRISAVCGKHMTGGLGGFRSQVKIQPQLSAYSAFDSLLQRKDYSLQY